MKKASLELGINFIVVMIISVILLGVGFFLVSKGATAWQKEYDKMKAYHESQIKSSMARDGRMVLVYPNTITTSQGEEEIFTLGINNELGQDEEFSIVVEPSATAKHPENKVLYVKDPLFIKNTQSGFTPIVITPAKGTPGKQTYIFNVCVFVGKTVGRCSSEDAYGDLQKITVNVK
ncbi:hypothetical protein JW826_03945 [Candidatus Woesearchaeota archaeon]|nr:hypothetical protein [Candidatus Woesearchaeota archaeon]